MTTFTDEQVQQMMLQLMGDANKLENFRKMLGVKQDKDKSKVLLDDYTFRRIDKFTGAEGTWQEWSFNVLMTVTQVDPELAEHLECIRANSTKPLHADIFDDIELFPKFAT